MGNRQNTTGTTDRLGTASGVDTAGTAGQTTAMETWLGLRADVRQQRGIVRTDSILPWREHSTSEKSQGEEVIDLASNDYLGLSADPRVVAASMAALEKYGAGARASRVVCGTLPAHRELEERLCALTGQRAALAFSSGYTANLGVVTALGGPGTLIIYDAHVHASLLDALRLSRSPSVSVPHNDLTAVKAALSARIQPRAVVIVESVYSVLGDAADLASLAPVCAAFDALLLVDEAHGLGVLGDGRGAVHAAGLAGAAHVAVTVTLSKALGSQGGAVLGSPALREHLVNTARTFIFDTALAPAAAAGAGAAASIVLAEPELAGRVLATAQLLARSCGVETAAGAVQSVPIESAACAVNLANELRTRGVLVGCFRPPSVPDGVSRIRLSARASITSAQLAKATGILAELLRGKPTGGTGHTERTSQDYPGHQAGLGQPSRQEGI